MNLTMCWCQAAAVSEAAVPGHCIEPKRYSCWNDMVLQLGRLDDEEKDAMGTGYRRQAHVSSKDEVSVS